MANNKFQELKDKLTRIADINYATAVLHWDKETYMPEKGMANRSRQLSTLSEIAHKLFTEKSTGKLLNELQSASLDETDLINILRTAEDYEKMVKLPGSFVAKSSELSSLAFQAWIEARKMNDFKLYEKDLDNLISHKRKEADLLGFKNHPYDALLDLYEPACTVGFLDNLFQDVKTQLVPLVAELR